MDLESGTPQGSGLPGLESAHFTGHQFDTDTGLHNMHLRMYSSELKRFLRPDPALDISMGTPQSWNLYGYVGNNPVNYIDPTGGQIVGYQDEIHEFPPLDINGLRPEIEDFSPPKIVDIFPWTKPLHDIANQMYYFIKRNPRALRAIAAGAVVVGMMWASTVPGIGEGMDVVACMTGSPLDCASALGSIAVNSAMLGTAGNSGAVTLGNNFRRSMGVAGDLKTVPLKMSEVGGGARSSLKGSLLREHLRQSDTYGVFNVRTLENGRIRYYGKAVPPQKKGEMAGRRIVREWNPATGLKRTWHETLDHSGRIRQVRPAQSLTGGSKVHYKFDKNGTYLGSW